MRYGDAKCDGRRGTQGRERERERERERGLKMRTEEGKLRCFYCKSI
jgi:hypothetical protein